MLELFSHARSCGVILASASPRRRSLLETYGIQHLAFAPDVLEKHQPEESARDYVIRNARIKAADIAKRFAGHCKQSLILASDTVVVSEEGQILEKPASPEDAEATLKKLSGKSHSVLSSLVVLFSDTAQKIFEDVVETTVEFAELPESWIRAYVASGEPMDKAGSYGIQGLAGAFVKKINGSYTNVVGLPLCETLQLLEELAQVRAYFLSQSPKRRCVAISKRKGTAAMRLAYHFGQRDFGENYIQELQEKKHLLSECNEIKWHFTGTIQRNKIKEIAKLADEVHALEDLTKTQMLEAAAKQENRFIGVFIKAEVSSLTKASSGCSWIEAHQIAQCVAQSTHLRLRGFMGMGPVDATENELLELFTDFMKQGEKIWKSLGQPKADLHFSMGMSGDAHIAQKAALSIGLNPPLTRMGTAIFGDRTTAVRNA